MKVIGAADEFWRLRLTRVDTTEELDFEWHPDILYREPHIKDAAEVEQWNVEAIRTEDYDTVIQVASFDDRAVAEQFFTRAEEDLRDMTKSQFEETYLTPSPSSEPEDEAL